VVVAFYVGAALLIITSLFTIFKVKEYDPETYALYHGISTEANEEKVSWIQLLKTAPKAFWTVTLVQFFCWFAFNTYGHIQLVQLLKMYGIQQTQHLKDIKQLVTGTEFWQRFNLSQLLYGHMYYLKFLINITKQVTSQVYY